MGTLTTLLDGLASGAIDVIDLTAPLSADTPIIQLPPEFGQTARFALEEISRYDERGPAWYWNNFRSGEHTGTHFDAPNHWVTGKDLDDVASVPASRLIAPAVVLDFSARPPPTPTSCSRSRTSSVGSSSTDRCRPAAGCSTAPDGTPAPTTRRTS